MRRLALGLFFLLAFTTGAYAALHFPALTGRVVDDAHILSPQTSVDLDQQLAAFENQTTDQLVVVTTPSLQGTSIEDYGYQLGRKWGIGQKDKNNGVLLIVAPSEHKIRIEVGYGLEGKLTDALSSQIIQNNIIPHFKAGQIEEGVVAGTAAIISTLGGTYAPPAVRSFTYSLSPKDTIWLIICALFLIGKFVLLMDPKFYRDHPILALFLLMSGSSRGSGGYGGGGGFSGGFSGGGGSFGGGGASGGW